MAEQGLQRPTPLIEKAGCGRHRRPGSALPEHARSIRRLEAENPTFRTICEDYGLALRALEHWRAADQNAQQKAEESVSW